MISIKRIAKKANPSSWAELKEHAAAGKLDKILHSGDTIDITLKNGENVTLMVGKDQQGTVYFTSKDCLSDKHVMNKVNTNAGGWANCEMRRYLNEDVFALLPDDLQAVIQPTKIVQIVAGERIEIEDKLFCFSETQVFGKCFGNSFEPEDSQIDIFKKRKIRIKKSDDLFAFWRLRSVGSISTSFRCVNDGGGYNYNDYASASLGVVFGIAI